MWCSTSNIRHIVLFTVFKCSFLIIFFFFFSFLLLSFLSVSPRLIQATWNSTEYFLKFDLGKLSGVTEVCIDSRETKKKTKKRGNRCHHSQRKFKMKMCARARAHKQVTGDQCHIHWNANVCRWWILILLLSIDRLNENNAQYLTKLQLNISLSQSTKKQTNW